MINFSQTVVIDRSQNDVFRFLNDIANHSLWHSNLTEITASNGTKVGSIITFVLNGLGKKVHLSGEVVQNNGIDSFRVASKSGSIKFSSSYQLGPLSQTRTSLTLTNDIDTGSIFALASPVLQHLAEVRFGADLKVLKAILEESH